MLAIHKSHGHGLETLQDITPGCWVNALDPDADEIARLQQELGLPPSFITHSLDQNERSRVEKEGNATLLVLRIPHSQGRSSDTPYISMPLGVILTDKVIVTICKMENDIIRDLLGNKVKDLATGNHNRFVLLLLGSMADQYLWHLQEIDATVMSLEDRLQRSQKNRELLELLRYQKSLVYFATALKTNELALQRLQKSGLFDNDSADDDLLEDVLTEIQQAIEMTNISSNILSQMMDAFASIISNNLNVVIKFLASITIVLSIPTIVASFYGMNVGLPLQEWPYAFWMTLGLSLSLSLIVMLIFWKKNWL